MREALLWGVVASSSLLIGGALALRVSIPPRVLGLVMAFGAGVLISSVSFELVEEAFDTSSGAGGIGWGSSRAPAVFFAGDVLLDRMGRAERKSSVGKQAGGSALAIVLGIVLDGVPESAVLGLTVLQEGSVSIAFLAAVFLSNLPEAIAATTGLASSGWRGQSHPGPVGPGRRRLRARRRWPGSPSWTRPPRARSPSCWPSPAGRS